MAPTSIVTPFEPLLPTDAQIVPHIVTPNIDAPIQYPWDLYLGPTHPLAPIDIATVWNTPASLTVPSVDTSATQTLNEGIEVKVPQSESNYD